jgi:hypothetical protein
LAKGWTISGVKALRKALEEGLQSSVAIEDIETGMRRVVAEELQPVQQALARLEAIAAATLSPSVDSSPVSLARKRMRQRRRR